jgi:hypothetical protein
MLILTKSPKPAEGEPEAHAQLVADRFVERLNALLVDLPPEAWSTTGHAWQLIIRMPEGSARPTVAGWNDVDVARQRFDQVVARLDARTECVVKLALVSDGGWVEHVDRSWENGTVTLEPEGPMYDDEADDDPRG